MVLRPIDTSSICSSPRNGWTAAFDAVEITQTQPAAQWWLVAQPDHAVLAGDLAATFVWQEFPKFSEQVLQAISLHDAGWSEFDGRVAPDSTSAAEARPISFLEAIPGDFLAAWLGSIERAVSSSAIGGILVSHHFSRLARSRLQRGRDAEQDVKRMQEFLNEEEDRREKLGNEVSFSEGQINKLVNVLQFCDLLSLYLCCGAQESVEFPQEFGGKTIRVTRDGDYYRSEPAIFGTGVSLGVCARRYPSSTSEPNEVTIPFLLS